MHRVLVPVDGSENSRRAVEFLIKFAMGRAAPQIHLLNVQPPIMSGDVYPSVTSEMVNAIHRTAGEEALKAASTLLDASKMTYSTRILFGDPAELIARFAREQGCDGIVMGTRGMGAVRNLVLGSVATKIVHLADVPVTLVK